MAGTSPAMTREEYFLVMSDSRHFSIDACFAPSGASQNVSMW